jgi:hypothetical protein
MCDLSEEAVTPTGDEMVKGTSGGPAATVHGWSKAGHMQRGFPPKLAEGVNTGHYVLSKRLIQVILAVVHLGTNTLRWAM